MQSAKTTSTKSEEYGTGYVFCQRKNSGGALQMNILKTRSKSYKDYADIASFMDCSNVRHAFSRRNADKVSLSTNHKNADQVSSSSSNKKRDHSNAFASNRARAIEYYPLIAFTLERGKRLMSEDWFLGIVFSLYPKNMIVAKAELNDGKLTLSKDLLRIDHCSSTYRFKSSASSTAGTFTCKYLNVVSSERACPVDGKLECSIYGPHRIHSSQVENDLLEQVRQMKKDDNVLVNIPPLFDPNPKKKSTENIPSTDPSTASKIFRTVYNSKSTVSVPVVEHKASSEEKMYAIVYSDKNAGVVEGSPSKMSVVKVAQLTCSKMKEMIARIHKEEEFKSEGGEVRIPHDDFNRMLDVYSCGKSTTIQSHMIPDNGIAFEIKDKGDEVKEKLLPHEREGLLTIFCGQIRKTRDFQLDLQLIQYMFRVSYPRKTSFTYNRSVAKCLGMNIYSGINDSFRVRQTPKKGKSAIMHSERFTEVENATFLPFLRYIMDKLAAHSNAISKAIDPVFDDFQRKVFSTADGGRKIDYNTDPGLRFNQLQIMTGPDDHEDKNDRLKSRFNERTSTIGEKEKFSDFDKIGRDILNKDWAECKEILKDRNSSKARRDSAWKSYGVIHHLMKLGGGEVLEDLSWNFRACCGYLAQ